MKKPLLHNSGSLLAVLSLSYVSREIGRIRSNTELVFKKFLESLFIYFNLRFFLKILFIYFLERGEGKEKERKRNINVWLLLVHPLQGNLACSPGMCPDWESNQRPLGLQAGAQSTKPYQPGPNTEFYIQIFRVYLVPVVPLNL